MTTQFRIGVDENGLGARLGPMLVTAVLAEVSPNGERLLGRRLPATLKADLDDSKRLVAFGSHHLGEAWARALVPEAKSPTELFERLSLDSTTELQSRCPASAKAQCWTVAHEAFGADAKLVRRIASQLERLRARGVSIVEVRTRSICTGELNEKRAQGCTRFSADLHAMEALVLGLRERAGAEVTAVCGKVGGISDYERFFGPLSGRLRVVLEQCRPRSSYKFPGLGVLHFVQDADASDPLVMLASLVGKYLRELLMARISEYYTSQIDELVPVSGYHDPVTARLVQLTARRRKKLKIPGDCFERVGGG